MLKESTQYALMDEESSRILEHFKFISTLIDQDGITAPIDMGITEVRALSRFLALESDMEAPLRIKIYLMGVSAYGLVSKVSGIFITIFNL